MRIALIAILSASCATAQATPRETAAMHDVRASHSATLLTDGRVLIAGGFHKGPDGRIQIYSDSAELYDAAASAFVPVGSMTGARCGHAAVLLADGRVLVAGGFGDRGELASAEIYDPATKRFVPTGSMTAPRGDVGATLLLDGRVLVAGGGDEGKSSAEIYDPATGRFVATGAMNVARAIHSATLLADGRVLIAGGTGLGHQPVGTSEIYDPATGRFTPAAALVTARTKHAAVRLADGRVLIVGGSRDSGWKHQLDSAELYDPRTERFVSAGRMHAERFKLPAGAALLPDGRVLVAGGSRALEIYDPRTLAFTSAGTLDDAYYFASATRLADGAVLVTGGYDTRLRSTARAWIVR